jgi:hypothetical protein
MFPLIPLSIIELTKSVCFWGRPSGTLVFRYALWPFQFLGAKKMMTRPNISDKPTAACRNWFQRDF